MSLLLLLTPYVKLFCWLQANIFSFDPALDRSKRCPQIGGEAFRDARALHKFYIISLKGPHSDSTAFRYLRDLPSLTTKVSTGLGIRAPRGAVYSVPPHKESREFPNLPKKPVKGVAHARARVRGYPFLANPYNWAQAGAIPPKQRQSYESRIAD